MLRTAYSKIFNIIMCYYTYTEEKKQQLLYFFFFCIFRFICNQMKKSFAFEKSLQTKDHGRYNETESVLPGIPFLEFLVLVSLHT